MNSEPSDKGFSSTYQGQLQKYTNVMKGWCPRWFLLNPVLGSLDYFLSESELSSSTKPRGTLQLVGAVISPSEEDSHTFAVNSASGEFFKLRASDAKERQEWVNRLRAVAENLKSEQSGSSVKKRPQPWRSGISSPWDNYAASVFLPATNPTPRVKDWATAHAEADQQLRLIGDLFDLVQRETDELPTSGAVSSSNLDVVQLAGTSLLTLHTLQDAMRLLENEAYRPSVLEH